MLVFRLKLLHHKLDDVSLENLGYEIEYTPRYKCDLFWPDEEVSNFIFLDAFDYIVEYDKSYKEGVVYETIFDIKIFSYYDEHNGDWDSDCLVDMLSHNLVCNSIDQYLEESK